MPIPEITKLSHASSDATAKASLSAWIDTEMGNKHTQTQAVAMCYQMVESKIGRTMVKSSTHQSMMKGA